MSAKSIGHVDVKSGSLLLFDFGVIMHDAAFGATSAKAAALAAFEMNRTEVPILGSINGVVVRGITPGRYPVFTEYLTEDEGVPEQLRRSVTVDFAGDDRPAARTIELGKVGVDCARVGLFDVDAVDTWNTTPPADGLSDIVFWGLHGAEVAVRFEAPTLADGTYGFVDLPTDDALAIGQKLDALRETGALRFAFDFRPHTDDFFLLRQIRTSPTESGCIEHAGYAVCGFMTTLGDGFFPVHLEVDEQERPLRCTIRFATAEYLDEVS